MSSLTATELREQYGSLLLEPPFCEAPSPYLLHQALGQKRPPVKVSYAAVRTWWNKYRVGGEQSVQSAKELDEKYGDVLRCEHIKQQALDPPGNRILAKPGILLLCRNMDKQRGFVNGALANLEEPLQGNAVFTARLVGTGSMV